MVKAEATKGQLVALLETANSRDRNAALRRLKKFPVNPRHQYDDENDPKNFKLKEYNGLQGFMCFRCDKPKVAKVKVQWTTSVGVKTICHSCFNVLENHRSLDKAKKLLSRIAAGKKVSGLE